MTTAITSPSLVIVTEKEANHIRLKQGEFFGYPKCCVNSFIKYLSGKGKRTQLQYTTAHPEGFVPCHKHAKQIHKGEIGIKDIIQKHKRVCSIEFKYNNYKGDYSTEIQKKEEFDVWFK